MAKKRKNRIWPGYVIIFIVIAVVIIALAFQYSQPSVCTQEAKICPDGSAVGRTGPNCEFAPCPSSCICPQGFIPSPDGSYCLVDCKPDQACPAIAVQCQNATQQCVCPEGYVLEGNVCNPKCYYSTPKCLMPSFLCNTTSNGAASVCEETGGTVTTANCCKSSGDFPNTCLIGACGCSPTNSHEVKVCDCGEGRCFDGNSCVPPVDNTTCQSDSDCVSAQCCHPTSCINKAYKGVCNLLCTQVCQGPLDCGAGRCGCVNNKCTVIPQ